jgi:hypothetical protein
MNGLYPDYVWALEPFNLGDNIVADPEIGIPGPYIGVKDKYWHTSGDVPSNYDREYLKIQGVGCALYLYLIANMDLKQADWLARTVTINWIKEVNNVLIRRLREINNCRKGSRKSDLIRDALDYLDYRMQVGASQVGSLANLFAGKSKSVCHRTIKKNVRTITGMAGAWQRQLKNLAKENTGKASSAPIKLRKAERLVPVRIGFGLPHFERIPDCVVDRYGITIWSRRLLLALFWCDGKRTLARIIRNVKHETGIEHPVLVDIFRILEKYNYIKFKK